MVEQNIDNMFEKINFHQCRNKIFQLKITCQEILQPTKKKKGKKEEEIWVVH